MKHIHTDTNTERKLVNESRKISKTTNHKRVNEYIFRAINFFGIYA